MSALQRVDLRSQDEIALGQPVALVSPDLHPHFSPGEVEVGMMPFGLGDRPHAVHKIQGRTEIGEGPGLFQMMLIYNIPPGHLGLHLLQRFALQRRYTAAAWYAMFFRQTHDFPPHGARPKNPAISLPLWR